MILSNKKSHNLRIIWYEFAWTEINFPHFVFPTHRFVCYTGIQLLTLLVPILINYLIEPHQMKMSTKYARQLHEQSLQWLMRIGPKYPQEFKALMGQTTELRVKLETAIRHSQQSTNEKLKTDMQSSAKQQTNHQKPTIELKTNFSNFSSSK